MDIGRNFTNCLNAGSLTPGERAAVARGAVSPAEADALVQVRAKGDTLRQLSSARDLGMSHVEFDGCIPNPFLSLPPSRAARTRAFAEASGLSTSLHVPHTGVAAAVSSLQEEDRLLAVSLVVRYMDFAAAAGCRNVNMHPGAVPWYQLTGKCGERTLENCARSFTELAAYARSKGMRLFLENNPRADGVCVLPGDCCRVIEAVRTAGEDVGFCFDVAHWATVCGDTLPEDAVDGIPDAYLRGGQVHLSDCAPAERLSHVPLHYQKGLLKRENLIRLFTKFRKSGVAVVIVETVVRSAGEYLDARRVMADERDYLWGVLADAG